MRPKELSDPELDAKAQLLNTKQEIKDEAALRMAAGLEPEALKTFKEGLNRSVEG
jgi:hypothetical protein